MRLLVIAQAVDQESPTLGFFIGWLKEFAAQCATIEVIGFKVGRHDLPPNVHVHAVSRGGVLKRLFSFWNLLRRTLPRVDGVFVHMSPEYAIAAWPLAALRKKPIVLWYAHRAVTMALRVAVLCSRKVLSIAPGSMNVPSRKAVFLGHGIPTGVFTPGVPVVEPKLLSVGRVTPIKRIEAMLDALAELRKSGIPAVLTLVGAPATSDDHVYAERLRAHAESLDLSDAVDFAGGIPYDRLPETYRQHALHINAAPTGAPDKAVFEAMSCGVPSLVANETFRALLGVDADALLVEASGEAIARKTAFLLARPDDGFRARLRAVVERDHSLKRLIRGIIEQYDVS